MPLEVRGLRRVIEDRIIIADVSLDLQPGEIVFVSGPSGCGKTLLLRSIAALDKYQGIVKLGGQAPEDMG